MAKAVHPIPASNAPANGGTVGQLALTPVPAGNRPTRKAKQAALDQKVWANDLPTTRKRALSSVMSVEPKKAKIGSTKSSVGGSSTKVNVPPRLARKTNILLAGDFDSSGEDDIPLSTARACPAPKARSAVATTQRTTHVEDFQAPCDDAANSEEDPSDDNVDPEARDQAVAEQSESDDELLASMEARGNADAISARLSAEASVPVWSQPKQKGKAVDRHAESEDEKSDNEPVVRASKGQSEVEQWGEKKLLSQAAGLSKTALRAQQERPVFKTPASHVAHVHATSSNSPMPPPPPPPAAALMPPPAPILPAPAAAAHEDDSSDSDLDLEMVEVMRPIDYQIVFPAQGGPLSLKAQHPDIQDVIQATITRLERKIVLEDAFPDAHKRGRGVRVTMVETVQELEPKAKYRSLLTRLITDAPFLKSVASIPNQRISSFHGKIKDKSNVSAPSFFGLAPGPEAIEHVRFVLPHLSYVYPVDFEVSDHLPYRAPIVINVLREAFFKGTKSFFSRNEDIFMSSLPGRDEREIPLIMLALVGTTIHGSLMDWRSGDCVETSPFSADRYLDAYTEHKVLLNAIKKSAPVKYHTMMYKLFDEASGAPVHAMPLGASAIAHLNLDAMEEA
ncbi:hypothetical protein GSI_01352 [Ganoderma sinense ZZ0214-1]|uniref:DUF6532 domain-containing protein n=1 Tax=Ganoderma sinense ZZ0214-1 TaxID=1077348 RepID=A0A2G8SVR1_9APHY|nr:hypothetical protein GSI_01352 [Ganoderma sinense ZZ0214-1]